MTTLVCAVLQVVEQRQFASCVVAKLYALPVSKDAYNVSNDVIRLLSKSCSPVDLPPDNVETYRRSSVEAQQTF